MHRSKYLDFYGSCSWMKSVRFSAFRGGLFDEFTAGRDHSAFCRGEIFGFPDRKNSHNSGFQPSGTESAFVFDQQKERRDALCFSILCLTTGAGRTGFIIGDLLHPDLIQHNTNLYGEEGNNEGYKS
ncbi:MAG: hypothetical protein IJG05_03305 [Solobacterium sp.]|nr:hypothetical protein [Solobacterium sp.]